MLTCFHRFVATDMGKSGIKFYNLPEEAAISAEDSVSGVTKLVSRLFAWSLKMPSCRLLTLWPRLTMPRGPNTRVSSSATTGPSSSGEKSCGARMGWMCSFVYHDQ